MRLPSAVALAIGLSTLHASAEMSKEEQNTHILHGLANFYAAGTVCEYKKWSFSKADTDELLKRLESMRQKVEKKTYDDIWQRAQAIMAEGQAKATESVCANVRDQYGKGRPFLLGLQPIKP